MHRKSDLDLLRMAYYSAVNNLIPWIDDARDYEAKNGDVMFTIRSLKSLCDNLGQDWVRTKTKDGHYAISNCLTGIHLGFPAHASHGNDDSVYGDIANAFLENVQEHLNVLSNELFAYTILNWKEIPDFAASLIRYQQWKKQKEQGQNNEADKRSAPSAARRR